MGLGGGASEGGVRKWPFLGPPGGYPPHPRKPPPGHPFWEASRPPATGWQKPTNLYSTKCRQKRVFGAFLDPPRGSTLEGHSVARDPEISCPEMSDPTVPPGNLPHVIPGPWSGWRWGSMIGSGDLTVAVKIELLATSNPDVGPEEPEYRYYNLI